MLEEDDDQRNVLAMKSWKHRAGDTQSGSRYPDSAEAASSGTVPAAKPVIPAKFKSDDKLIDSTADRCPFLQTQHSLHLHLVLFSFIAFLRPSVVVSLSPSTHRACLYNVSLFAVI